MSCIRQSVIRSWATSSVRVAGKPSPEEAQKRMFDEWSGGIRAGGVAVGDWAPSAAGSCLDAALAAHATGRPPALVIAAFDRSGVIAWRGAGSGAGGELPVTQDTVFRIASMTKSFLAATALALSEDGRLDLHLPITAYVPGVRLLWRGQEQHVSVAELLGNRSGLPEDNAWGDRQLSAARSDIHDLFAAGIELTAAPGDQYQYSNLGMSLVGRAIEQVVERPVEEEIRARFLEPLGLTSTRFSAADYPAGTDIARGYRSFDEGQSFVEEPFIGPGALGCIGGLFSTVADIAAWAWFLASGRGDSPLRPELLSPRARREMQRVHTAAPTAETAAGDGLEILGYGLGLFASQDRRFGRIADHSGGLPGFSSHMRWHLDSGIGVVAFANSDSFRTEPLAAAAHRDLLTRAGAPSGVGRPWAATLDAAEEIDRLLRTGRPLTAAVDRFAANFFADAPDIVRRQRFARLGSEVGAAVAAPAVRERLVCSADAAHLRWRIDCAEGAILCDIRLIGTAPALVQSLSLAVAGPDGRTPRGTGASSLDRAVVLLPER